MSQMTMLAPRHAAILTRMLACVGAGIALLLLASIGIRDYETRIEQARLQTFGQARALAGHAERTFGGADLVLSQTAERIAERWRAGNTPDATLQGLLDRSLAAAPQLRSIILMERDGSLIAGAQAGESSPPLQADHDFVRANLRHPLNNVFLGKPAITRFSGDGLFGAGHPVLNPEGNVGAILAVLVEPGFFEAFYDNVIQDEPRGRAALLSADGRTVSASTGSPDESGSTGIDLPEAAALAAIGQRQGGPYRALTMALPDQPVTSVIPVQGLPLFVAASIDRQAVLAAWYPRVLTLVAAAVVIGLAAVLFLKAGSGNAARLSATKGELRQRILDLEASEGALRHQGKRLAAIAAELFLARREADHARQQADNANRAKSEFLARMSHELRTPLNAILGFSEIMKGRVIGLDTPDNCVRYAEYIYESGTHLLSLINDVLDLAKIEAGGYRLQESCIDLETVASAATRLVGEQARRRQVALDWVVPDDLPSLWADERLVKQMLLNLLSNALKFTLSGGSVRLTASASEEGLAIQIADTGVGIAPRDIETAVAPFGQVPGAVIPEGTGLGLPLVKAFVELHGGRFEIASVVGAGTTVTLRFPGERLLPPNRHAHLSAAE